MEEIEYQRMFDIEQTHWWFLARKRFLRSVFKAFRKQKYLHIADIGAGTGGMYSFLQEYGSVIAIEPYGVARRFAKNRFVPMRPGKAENTGLSAGSQDVVCIFDVLYHRNVNERLALAEAKRILKPRGAVIITDCAFEFLSGDHDSAVHGARRFTIQRLKHLLRESGFVVERATYLYFFLFPVIVVRRFYRNIRKKVGMQETAGSDMVPIPRFANMLCDALCAIESLLLGRLPFPWGSSVMVVARKRQ